MDFNFSLDGVVKPPYLKVKAVHRSILPSINQNVVEVNGRPGAIDFGNEIGSTLIELDVMIEAGALNSLPPLLRQLAEYLYTDEAVKLVIDDEPDKYYMAKLTGDTDIEEILYIGEGTISFICYDPFAHGEELTFNIPKPYAGEIIQISNLGTAPTSPIIKLNISKDITALNVVSGDNYIGLGKPLSYGETAVNYDPYVLKDKLTTLSGWNTAVSTNVHSVVFGIEEWEIFNNSAFRPKGTAWDGKVFDGWAGGAIERGLTGSPNDWEFTLIFHFNAKDNKGTAGLGGASIVDSSGMPIVTMDMIDSSRGTSGATARFSVLSSNGNYRDWMGQVELPGPYKDFVGYLTCRKVGNKLTTKVAVCTAKDAHKSTFYEKWNQYKVLKTATYVDSKNLFFPNRKPYKAQIFTATFGEIDTSDKDNKNKVNPMEFYDIYVQSLDKKDLTDTQKPIIATAGDTIDIYNETGEIFKNGELWYDYFNPFSTFITLNKKENGIVIEPYDAIDGGTITYIPNYR